MRAPARGALAGVALALASCGGHATTRPHPAPPRSTVSSKAAEIARERAAASFARPPARVVAAAGPTPAARNASARVALVRAARDLQRYHRAHGTYAIGPIENLRRLDPGVALVDFVDGRQTSFFLAVDPPTTTTTWRYDFDHGKAGRACGPGGTACPPSRTW